MDQIEYPEWMTAEQAAEWLTISRRRMDELKSEGRLDGAYFQAGDTLRYHQPTLLRVLLRIREPSMARRAAQPVPEKITAAMVPPGWVVPGARQRLPAAQRQEALRTGRVVLDPANPPAGFPGWVLPATH